MWNLKTRTDGNENDAVVDNVKEIDNEWTSWTSLERSPAFEDGIENDAAGSLPAFALTWCSFCGLYDEQ